VVPNPIWKLWMSKQSLLKSHTLYIH